MNQPCLKLTTYFAERQRAVGGDRRFLADAMLDKAALNELLAKNV